MKFLPFDGYTCGAERLSNLWVWRKCKLLIHLESCGPCEARDCQTRGQPRFVKLTALEKCVHCQWHPCCRREEARALKVAEKEADRVHRGHVRLATRAERGVLAPLSVTLKADAHG